MYEEYESLWLEQMATYGTIPWSLQHMSLYLTTYNNYFINWILLNIAGVDNQENNCRASFYDLYVPNMFLGN